MKSSEEKEYTRLLKRQIRKSFGNKEITSPELLKFINLVNEAYIFNEEEDEFYRKAEETASKKYEILTKELLEKNSFLNSFNHGMAHDVKNHSSNIIGLIQMLKKYSEKEDWKMINEIIKQLGLSSNQLTSIVQGFLYLSRLEFEKDNSQAVTYSHDLKEEIEYEILFLKENKEVNIEYDLLDVKYNQQVIKIILVNLISNAIKYSKKDIPANIKVSLFCDEMNVVLEVEDNGIGIDLEKDKKKLFNLYSDIKVTKGYGVGLYLIRKIVDKSKGKVDVESGVGKGTTFKITLPKKRKA